MPAATGQEKAKDEKKDAAVKDKDTKKPQSAKQQYDALVKDFLKQRNELRTEINKSKGEEQQKLIQKYLGAGKEFADKFYQLAEDYPKDPVAADALFWIVQNAGASDVAKKATDRVNTLIAEMPLADLGKQLKALRGAHPVVLDAVIKRAEKDEKDPAAGDLLAWAGTYASDLPAGQKAIERLIEKYPDHASIEQVCIALGQGNVPNADAILKSILAKNDKPRAKAAAALALGQILAAKTDELGDDVAKANPLAAEGEKYLAMAVELYKESDPQRKVAEQQLNALRTVRVGKEAPDIKAPDIDGKQFKLSDYRGKVVLLDFWGHW